MKKICLFFLPLLVMGAYAQNLPVAVEDSAQVMNQKLLEVNSLLNDYDPDGDTIEIIHVWGGPHDDDHWFEDSLVYYISEWHEGWDYLRYKVAKVNNPSMESERAYIRIEVLHNPDVPVAVEDTFFVKYLEPTPLFVMVNDYDPNGDEIMIGYLGNANSSFTEISIDSTHIIFTSDYSPTNGTTYFFYSVIEKNTQEKYYSDLKKVKIYLLENEDLPIAINDTFEVTGGITAVFDVLANDHIPLTDTLEFIDVTNPHFGEISLIDNKFHYTANTSYKGIDDFKYSLRYKNSPWLYSEEAEVRIQVNKNPDCPVGTPDYGSGMAYTEIPVEVLSNDYDPNGDEFEIMDVYTYYAVVSSISFAGNIVTYRPPAYIAGPDSAFYRIRQVNDTTYFSEWIPIYFEVYHNPGYPLAQPDSATTRAGIKVFIDFRKNDIVPDSIEITSTYFIGGNKGIKEVLYDSIMYYTPFSNSYGKDTIIYRYTNFGHPPHIFSEGKIVIDIENNHSYDSLTINNINAGINASGMQFTRIDEIPPNYGVSNYKPHFEVPKGSGNQTMFCNTLWIGGMDNEGMLHLAGERYRHNGYDYQPGPVGNNYDSAFFYHWNTMWKMNRSDVEYHRNNWWKEGYEPIRSIAEWPGNGDLSYGMAEQLAPYYDQDGDDIYDPMSGDYPLIRGDQCIFFFTNDVKFHSNTQALLLGVEIQGMAYAYAAPDDSILNNTVFVHYSLINRSDQTYFDSYFGVFTDIDLGYAWDDYVECHVEGSSYYVFNGEETDGQGEPGTYGNHPPAQSVTIMAGPFIDPDMEDNPEGGCDYSVNGLNFGNGIPDDERYGMTRFTYFNSSAGPQGDPSLGDDYYRFLQGLWKDDTPVSFGGNGHPLSGAVGPDCRFMYPGDTDPLNWGTDCEWPNGGWNQNDKFWTEEAVDNSPDDRRGLGVSGPFTFHPGDVQEVDMAYVFANSYHSADSSKNLLKKRLIELRQRVLDGEIIIPNEELDISEHTNSSVSIDIYPNPAGSVIFIEANKFSDSYAEYNIYNTLGTIVKTGRLITGTRNEITISALEPGFYIIAITTANTNIANKFIKY